MPLVPDVTYVQQSLRCLRYELISSFVTEQVTEPVPIEFIDQITVVSVVVPEFSLTRADRFTERSRVFRAESSPNDWEVFRGINSAAQAQQHVWTTLILHRQLVGSLKLLDLMTSE